MNCTNPTKSPNEIPPFKARCNRKGIHVPGDNPTPAEIIPIIEQHLAAHQKHPSKDAKPWTGDFAEWKLINDDYHQFLIELRAAHALSNSPHKNSPQKSELSESAVANQHPSSESKVSSGESEVSSAESQLTSTESNSPKTSSPPSHSPHLSQESHSSHSVSSASPNSNSKSDNAPVDIPKYLDTAAEAAIDLQQYLSGRSPLDDLTPPQQEAILLMLNDYPAWRVAQVIAQPPPRGFNI